MLDAVRPLILLTAGAIVAPAAATTCSLEQITSTETFETVFLVRPSYAWDGNSVNFTLRSDPLGSNADNNWEIFRYTPEGGLEQITNTDGDSGSFESFPDRFGGRMSLESSAALVPGGNPEGNAEVFLWDRNAGFTQVSSTTVGGVLTTRLASDGRRIVFSHTGDVLAPSTPDGAELYYWMDGSIEALTDVVGEHLGPHCINQDGSVVAFGSSADLTGGNTDKNGELFVWTEGAGIVQWTDTQIGEVSYCQMSRDGNRIAIHSDHDLTGANPDALVQLFVLDGPGSITQVTSGVDLPGRFFGADGDLQRIAFSSSGDLALGPNPDGSEEVFIWDRESGIAQITDLPADANVGDWISLNEDGTRIAFSGTADVTGDNPDGSAEVFVGHCPLADVFALNAGHAAVWTPFDGDRNVESSGIFLELVPEANIALPHNVLAGAWFTHDETVAARFPGETNRWLTLQGTWEDGSNTATFSVFQVLDGDFNGESPGQTVTIGQGLLRVFSCTDAEIAFTLFDYSLGDRWTLQRTFGSNGEFCQLLATPPPD